MQQHSVYMGKRTHQTYYIGHSFSDGLTVRAFLANDTNPFKPLRALVGSATFGTVGDAQIWSSGSHVASACRRDGLLTAMYDHAELNGFTVVPADGSTGERELQTQSQDGKAFWQSRHAREGAVELHPCTEREFAGWDNPFASADEALGKPVHQKLNVYGFENPLLVLWGWRFDDGEQRVGVIYQDERGYAPMVMVGNPAEQCAVDVPVQQGDRLRYRNSQVTQKMRDKTADQMKRLSSTIMSLRSQ